MVDTRDISLFLTIARLGSISRTAEQMFMSQSTVTTHLQRLERVLGYSLFHRTQTGVQLTREGQSLIPLAEDMVNLEEQILHPEPTTTLTLRIMSGRAFVSTDVPECLRQISKRIRVHLKVRMGMYDEMEEALLTQQVDFCFLGEPIYHPSVKQIELEPDAIDLIVPKHHYFAHAFPGLQALNQEPFIAFGRSSSPLRKRIAELLAQHDVYPKIGMELDSIDGIKAMVGHGLGVSLLPRRTLHDADFKSYVPIPLPGPEWIRPTYLAYPSALEGRPVTDEFIDVVKGYYQSSDPTQRR